MFPRTGEWFVSHGMMNNMMVSQIMEWQKHGDGHRFGEIALMREMITGRQLKEYYRDMRLHNPINMAIPLAGRLRA